MERLKKRALEEAMRNATSSSQPPAPSQTHGFRVLLFTDIVKSSELWELDTEGMTSALDEHGKRLKAFVDRHGGMVVKTIGDAFMVVFGEADTRTHAQIPMRLVYHAVGTAVDIQRDLSETPIMVRDRQLRIRLGIAYGDVAVETSTLQHCTNFKDYFGGVVNTASRMESVVSPVGGFAIAINDDMELAADVVRIIKDAAANVEIARYSTTCNTDTTNVMRRSMRLLGTKNVRCENVSSLKGVGEKSVVVVHM